MVFSFSLKSGGRRFDIFVVAGGTVRCVTTYGTTGDGGIVGLTTFCFQRSTDKIFTHDYTEIVSSLKCTWYFCFIVPE